MALDRSVQFITSAIVASYGFAYPHREGVLLEKVLEKYEKEGWETMASSKEYLTGLFQAMYEELPAPKKKNVRKQI